MASFGSFETDREVYSDPIYTVYSATRAGDSKSEFAVKVFSIQQTALEPGTAETLQPLLEDIENSRSEAIRLQAKAASTSKYIAPVFLTGQDERGVWYATKFYPRSVNRIISGRVALNREALHHILRCVALGALDLKSACGRSHGGILPSIVQISKSEKLSEADVVLSDPLPGAEGDAARFEISDLNAIGRIFLQLIAQRALEEHDFLILPILSSPEWTRVFGKDTDPYLAICNRLLDPNLSLADYTLERLVADLAALEPKQTFSPKWAIAAALAVLVLAGGFFVVKSLTGGTKNTQQAEGGGAGNKEGGTGHGGEPPRTNPVVTPPNGFGILWSNQFHEHADLHREEGLQNAFADVVRNSAAFNNELMAWWDSRPTQMRAISSMPGSGALGGAIDAELRNRENPEFSSNLIASIESRMKVRGDLAQTVNKLIDRWHVLNDGLASASNNWTKFKQPPLDIGTLFTRDFRAALGRDEGIVGLSGYQDAFSRAEQVISKYDYNPPKKLETLSPENRNSELKALQDIVDGVEKNTNYDDWRGRVDGGYTIVNSDLFKSVKNWPPRINVLDTKIADLQTTVDDPDFPAESQADAKRALEGFKAGKESIKAQTDKATTNFRGAIPPAEKERLLQGASNLVVQAEELAVNISTERNKYIGMIAKATTSRRQVADLDKAGRKIADGDYDGAIKICGDWPGDPKFQDLNDKAKQFQTALAAYKAQFAQGDTRQILSARNLPTNHYFQDVVVLATSYSQARTKFDSGDYTFTSDPQISAHAAEKPFASLLADVTAETSSLKTAQDYEARNDAAAAISFVKGLDPAVSRKPKFQAVLTWANKRINRDAALKSAKDLYAEGRFSEALTACADYQNTNDKEFDDLAANLAADQKQLNKLNAALQDGGYGEVLSAEATYGNRNGFSKVISQARTESDYLDKLKACTNDAAPNLQGALDTLNAMKTPNLAGVTNKPPFQPIMAWVAAQTAAKIAKQKELQAAQQKAVDSLDAEFEGWLVKFSVIDNNQVHFPTYQNQTIKDGFGDANNGSTKKLGNQGVGADDAATVHKIFDDLRKRYERAMTEYGANLLDQTGPWKGHKDPRRKDFESLLKALKPFE